MSDSLIFAKDKIASYVHDATDIERRIFTLEQTADDLALQQEGKKIESQLAKEMSEVSQTFIFHRPLRDYTTRFLLPEFIRNDSTLNEKFWELPDEIRIQIAESIDSSKPIEDSNQLINALPQEEQHKINELESEKRRNWRQEVSEFQKKEMWYKARMTYGISFFVIATLFGAILLFILSDGVGPFEFLFALIIAGLVFAIPAVLFSFVGESIANSKIRDMNAERHAQNEAYQKSYNAKKAKIEAEFKSKREQLQAKTDKALAQKRAELKKISEDAAKQAEYFAVQEQELRAALKPLYEQRDKFYSAAIVPPDYRTMDCVYAFDQMFRNDLVDNMREAVKMYEERVFRGEIVRGIRSLEQFMGNVSVLLTQLHYDLSNLKNEVRGMNKDVVRIYEQQARLEEQNAAMLSEAKQNNAALLNELQANRAELEASRTEMATSRVDFEARSRELFKETQMSRYALEALKENNDKIVKYIED